MTRKARTTATTATATVQSPCDRAAESRRRAEVAETRLLALVEADQTANAELALLLQEASALRTATDLAAQVACLTGTPHARRLAASSRAKRASQDATEAAEQAEGIADTAQAEADDAAIETAENSPGYTTDPIWLAAQERRAARLHRS